MSEREQSTGTPPPPRPAGPVPFPEDDNGSPTRRHAKGWWRWAVGAVLLGLVVVGLMPRALPVEVAKVTRGPFVVTVNEEGRTRVREKFVVSSPVAGQLRRIELEPGDPVVAGETVLAVLETSGADLLDARTLAQAEARAKAAKAIEDQAAAELERARANDALAQTQLARAKRLFAAGASSQQELDAAQQQADASAQGVRAAEFAERGAKWDWEQAQAMLAVPPGEGTRTLELKSPVSGKVLRRLQESERVVPPGFPLLEVGDPTSIEAVIEVLSRDAVAIKPGARVWLDRWGGDEPLNGRVRLCEPEAFTKFSALGVEEQRVNVIVDLTDPVEKRATLGDAYRVEARIESWSADSVLQVPAGALFQRDGQWEAFVVAGGHAQLRKVEAGRGNGTAQVIQGGLKEGDEVAVYPGDGVHDGARVKVEAAQ